MTSAITQRHITLVDLDAVKRPIAEANGMPRQAYTDHSLFEFEREQVLGRTWAALIFSSELPVDGYAKPVDFMGIPLLVTRDKTGTIRVFHNICSHRGMPLLKEETEVMGSVRCPYHSWTYTLEGKLRGTPHIGGIGVHETEDFDCKNHGLKEISSAIWLGIVFINLSGDAPEFSAFIEPLVSRWEPLLGRDGIDTLRSAPNGSRLDIEVKANWKLAVENYCEAYHLPWVHPGLNSYSPLEQHYNILANDYMSGQGSYTYTLSDIAGTTLPKFDSWPEDRTRHAEYISLYPNVLLGIQVDHVFVMILDPLATDKTLEKLEIFYVGDESSEDVFAACRSAVLDSWRIVFGEDIFAVEGMQEGRKSPAFSGGVFSPVLDTPSHHFHAWVADRYSESNGDSLTA